MSTDFDTVISDQNLTYMRQTAISLHESATKLSSLARSKSPNIADAKWLIKNTYFTLQFLSHKFDQEL